MSLSKFESEVKILQQSQEVVYARFSDLNNLSSLKERLTDPEVRTRLSAEVSDDKFQELEKYVDGLTFDTDSIQIESPIGKVLLRIVEREEPKCIKFASEGAPVQLYLWIQLLPYGEQCKMRVTIGAEVNFFMKGMVAKPLQQAADGLANILSAVK